MSEFLQRVQNVVEKRRLLSRGQKILVAVSGGADSMVLLHALHSLAKQNRWKIAVANFNHHLRGRASDADERLVRHTAAQLRLKCFAGGADVKAFAAQSKLSLEMAARKLRHEFLARVARDQNIPVVALAHHADDQVEQFFLRLLRGAGGEGLAGMKWRSPSPADKTVSLVRPLLGFTKDELLESARKNKIRFRDDATNFSPDFLRNRIRHELLPLLRKKYQPGLDKTVLRLMEIAGAEAEFVANTAERWRKHLGRAGLPVSPDARQRAPTETAFEKLPVAVQRKVLQRQLAESGIAPDFDLIEQLREAPGKFVSVGTALSVARTADGKLEWRRPVSTAFISSELKMKLPGRNGKTEFAGRRFRWQRLPVRRFSLPPKTPGREVFDADKIGGEIILRHWRPGDRFQPIGLKSPAKLQDLFVNVKLPAARRRMLVLATTTAGEIFWVEGLRIGERFKLTPSSARKLVWRWSGTDD